MSMLLVCKIIRINNSLIILVYILFIIIQYITIYNINDNHYLVKIIALYVYAYSYSTPFQTITIFILYNMHAFICYIYVYSSIYLITRILRLQLRSIHIYVYTNIRYPLIIIINILQYNTVYYTYI